MPRRLDGADLRRVFPGKDSQSGLGRCTHRHRCRAIGDFRSRRIESFGGVSRIGPSWRRACSGAKSAEVLGTASIESEDVRQLLQSEESAGSSAFADLESVFRAWYAWTVDLLGIFFIETVERLYKRNEIAGGSFVALGQKVDLKTFTAPLLMLAARDDELVAPAQLFAAGTLVGTSPDDLCKATAPCRHLGLFMGKNILRDVWPDVARWLAGPTGFDCKL